MVAGSEASSGNEGEPCGPLISVVIPTYNRGDLVIEALKSVFNQTYNEREIEVIVVDDGSTDDTAARLAPFLGRIRLFRQANRGVAAARNLGVRHARGEFVCFLDSDDLWMPLKLEEQIAFARMHPEYALISTEIEGFDGTGPISGRGKADLYRIRNGNVLEQLLFRNWIQTSSVMVQRAVLLCTGGFDESVGNFGEDWLLWMRIAAANQIYFLPKPLVRYRVHSRSLSYHLPESQFGSLMAILDKLALLPQFENREKLIRQARYRVALGRGRGDLRAGCYEPAVAKFRVACASAVVPARAWMYLFWARCRRRTNGKGPDEIAAESRERSSPQCL